MESDDWRVIDRAWYDDENVERFTALLRPPRVARRMVDRGASRIVVRVAHSERELRAATKLVASRYAWRGYGVGTFDPTGLTLIARGGEATLGTLTLRLDGPLGLRAEESYGLQIGTVRAAGKRVCELTRLAVAAHAPSMRVLAAMFARAYHVGRAIHDVTDVFIEVNPRHVDFYRKVLRFAVAAGARTCSRVLAPSVLMRLELAALDASLGAIPAPLH